MNQTGEKVDQSQWAESAKMSMDGAGPKRDIAERMDEGEGM